jgi:scyllo-inositol 2-dehydrogenase (NADP+)
MIEVGLIGFGLAGGCFHAPVICAVSGLRLAAIVQRRGEEATRTYPGTRIVRSVEELLTIETIRLVVIATPNQTHYPLAKQCLESGRDVVVDKPFTTTVAEAVDLFRIASKNRRLLTVYHNRRFDADFQAAREVVCGGTLGAIVRFDSHYDRYRPISRVGAWREKPGPGSGVLFDLAPHLIDQALTLFGPPEAISADIRFEREGFSTDDAFDVTLRFSGSLRAELKASMLCATPRPRMVLLGEKGSYVKTSFDPLESSLRSGTMPQNDSWVLEKEENWGELTLAEAGGMRKRKVASKGDWREFYANVRDALSGHAPLLVTPQQALDVMVALELAVESNRKRCTVPWRNVTP